MEKTLVIIKPGAIQRELIGEIITRFERKGLQLCGMKMMQLTDEILEEHYAHIADKPFFKWVKESMMRCPVVVCCWAGLDAVHVVHEMAGKTNGREAVQGTLRGDFSISNQKNIVHTSDTVETAKLEVARFFVPAELFDYKLNNIDYLYSWDEIGESYK